MGQGNKISKEDALVANNLLEKCINQLQIALHLKEDTVNDGSRDVKLWNFVINSLRVTNEELKSENTFTLLRKIVEQERQRHNEDNGSVSTLNKYKSELSELDKQIAETETSFRTEIHLKRRIIDEQTEELENLKIQNESRLKFEKKWLSVQAEENDLKCELEEAKYKTQIDNLKLDINEERKVHAEVLWYYEEEKKKVDELISYWKERFRDIDERKTEIENLHEKREAQRDELDHYRTLYNERNQQMQEYEADKEIRRKEYEYEQHRHKMATKIQAWWRGVMVRRGLGPYKHLLKMKDMKKRKMSLKKGVKK